MAAILLALAAPACLHNGNERAECAEGRLAAIEAAYVAEALAACKAEGKGYDDCEALPVLRAKYDVLREEWVQCQ